MRYLNGTFSKLAVIVLCSAALSACASVTRGSNQNFSIQSDPPGATATLSTGISCNTPCELKQKRRDSFTVTIAKEGFKPITVPVKSSVKAGGGAAVAGNVLVGGVIGAAVDAGTGAAYTLSPDPVVVKLAPVNSPEPSILIPNKPSKEDSDDE